MNTHKSAGKIKQSRLSGLVSLMWQVMSATGNGYKRNSLRHTGKDDDRRNDKLHEISYIDANEKQAIKHEAFMFPETKLERAARLHKIGLRR